MPESSSFLKKRTKKLLRINARSIRKGRSQNNQKFFAAFFPKRSPSFFEPPGRPTWAVVKKERLSAT
jgi:hypothetical protein